MSEQHARRPTRHGDTPTTRRHILLVGVEPALVNFDTIPGWDAASVRAAQRTNRAGLRRLGLTVHTCVLDFEGTTEETLVDTLSTREYACVMVGAGIRAVPENLPLFERVVNAVHRHAPEARLCSNTTPSDTVEAARRALDAIERDQ
ncbi:hypothetical protein [Actinoalloteichus caeruleus]|uniref:hypothetical protein n=1 Tax=Actinoalloteichus cyanogriseus TaxID=2893586 RepID=UPI003AAB5CE1